MTPSELKAKHEQHHPESQFFARESMRFFGDTMTNYGVRAVQVRVNRHSPKTIDGFELYRKRPVKHGLQSSAYFSAHTFARVYSIDD